MSNNGSESPNGASPTSRKDTSAPDPLEAGQRLVTDLTLLKEQILHLLSLKGIALKAALGRILLISVAALVAVLVAATVLVVGAAQLTLGLAQGLATLLPESPWLGGIISGVLILSIFALGLGAGWLWIRTRSARASDRRHQRYVERLAAVRSAAVSRHAGEGAATTGAEGGRLQ